MTTKLFSCTKKTAKKHIEREKQNSYLKIIKGWIIGKQQQNAPWIIDVYHCFKLPKNTHSFYYSTHL